MAPYKFSRLLKSNAEELNAYQGSFLPSAEEKLLDQNIESDAESNGHERITTERLLRRWKLIASALGLMVSLLLVMLLLLLQKSHSHSVPRIFSPAEAAIEYETVVFHNNFHEDRTPYQGPPTDEVDKAWNDLYSNIGIIRIDGKAAMRLPNQTLPIPGDEDQYIVGIEVFHQLHCLNSIRKALYPERYKEKDGLTGKALLGYQIHLEHCVDSIRQTIQCYSDISTIPWIINPYHHRPAPDAHTTHVCRNFEKLQDWVRERAITQEEYHLRLAAQSHPRG